MDIRCPICIEPWDMDSLHDAIAIDHTDKSKWYTNGRYDDTKYAKLYSHARKTFARLGCAYMEYGDSATKVTCKSTDRGASAAVNAVYDMLGDDMDGAASMLEDAELLGLFD